jgi:hypothetical protein
MRLTNIIIFGTLLLQALLLSGCSEEEPIIVPDVYVNFDVNLDLPQFTALNAPGNAVKKNNEGYDENGVIIYRRFDDTDGTLYFAFDATCPKHIEVSTSINLDGNGAAQTGTCPHCSTKYYFENFGYPASGYPLKRYRTSLFGRILRVSN